MEIPGAAPCRVLRDTGRQLDTCRLVTWAAHFRWKWKVYRTINVWLGDVAP